MAQGLLACVLTRRDMGGGLAFLSVQEPEAQGKLQLLCQAETWAARRPLLGLLRPGTLARFGTETVGEDLVAVSAEVLEIATEPAAVVRLVAALAQGALTAAEAALPLRCTEAEALELLQLHEEAQLPGSGPEAPRRWRAATLARCRVLRGLPAVKQGRQRAPHLHRRDLELLERAESKVPAWPPLELAGAGEEEEALAASHPSENLLEPERKSRRGPLLLRDYAHGKKGPQVAWFLARLREMLPLGEDADEKPLRPLHFLDVGGGRGDLAIGIASAFRQKCSVTVLEQNEASLAQGRARAQELGLLSEVSWLCKDVRELQPGDLSRVDVVLGLHTCGGLADAVLALACRFSAAFLLCPCCFLKHPGLVPEANSWRAPASGLEEAEVEVLTRLAESDDRQVSLRAMAVVNSARLEALQRALPTAARLRHLAFPETFSLRNLALQGFPVEA